MPCQPAGVCLHGTWGNHGCHRAELTTICGNERVRGSSIHQDEGVFCIAQGSGSKLRDLELQVGSHAEAIQAMVSAIEQLMQLPLEEPKKRRIGFQVEGE